MYDTPTITVPNIQPGMVLDFGGEYVESGIFIGEAEVIAIRTPGSESSKPFTLTVSPEDGSTPELTVAVNPWRSFAIVG